MRLYRLGRVRVLAHRTERTQRDSGRGRTLQPGDDLFEVASEPCWRRLPGKPLPQSGDPPELREYRRHDVVAADQDDHTIRPRFDDPPGALHRVVGQVAAGSEFEESEAGVLRAPGQFRDPVVCSPGSRGTRAEAGDSLGPITGHRANTSRANTSRANTSRANTS